MQAHSYMQTCVGRRNVDGMDEGVKIVDISFFKFFYNEGTARASEIFDTDKYTRT